MGFSGTSWHAGESVQANSRPTSISVALVASTTCSSHACVARATLRPAC